MLIHNKDYIEFVTEFPCLLGHPVVHENQKTMEYETDIIQWSPVKL